MNALERIKQRMTKHRALELSKASGVDRDTIRRIKNGITQSPGFLTLAKIQAAMDSMEGVEHE